ncbi:MAG: glycosyltransferase, partial [Ignavibacteriae bacterium]|nr:glycosyltransferase [Ignavibacteriota bacterium]
GNHAFRLLAILERIGLPVVVHFHGYDASRHDVIAYCDNYKGVFEHAHKVVVVSKVMYERLLDLGCPEEKLVYNVYGPRPEFHDVQPQFSTLQFVGIGRFTDKKAPYYTLMAFKEIAAKYPDTKLLLAGDGTLLNACKNLVNYYGLESQVQFLGVIDSVAYKALLETSLAFVQHSITAESGDMEGTPLSILEASAAGLPVISTLHAGIPDVIVDGETGLLCAEHDVADMAKNMMRLLDDVNFAKELGSNGKQRILSQFTLKQHIEALQSSLESE